MNVIHINSYLSRTSLYYNLFSALENLSMKQIVLVPLKCHSTWEWKPSAEVHGVKCKALRYQNTLDRLFYRRKIRKGVQMFEPMVGEVAKQAGIMHAHTLFSDGGLAYEFSRKMDLPYIITVRNTDLNVFWKYMPHLRCYGRQVLKNASAVIFLSEAYRQNLRALVTESFWAEIECKCQIIPNGIGEHWFEKNFTNSPDQAIRLLYLGRFDKNKNLHGTIRAANLLRAQGKSIILRLVGAQGSYADLIRSQYPCEWIEYIDYTKDKEELKKHFAWASIFAMPSFCETFGLVYAEALSQGVPVIYSKGQGFDGWCPDPSCGLSVDPYDIENIASAISRLVKANKPDACRQLAENFRWEKIAAKYHEIYSYILCNKVKNWAL